MGLGFLKMVAGNFHVFAGPLVTLLYPLCASIRAIESKSDAEFQQWLTYWVLLTLIIRLELMLAEGLKWLPLWPCAKLMVTCWLVLPYFSGAGFVYEHFVRPCFSVNPQRLGVWFIMRKDSILNRLNDFLVAAERYVQEHGTEAIEKLISKNKSGVFIPAEMNTGFPQLPSPKKAQKECGCAPCLVSTTSEGDLKGHHRGMKHKVKEEELIGSKMASKNKEGSAPMLQRTEKLDSVEDFEISKSVPKRIRWCTWETPEIGWTKLNTDGSIGPENAGIGGLLRDYTGNPICAFVSKAPRAGSFLIELWAIWRGLILASGQGIKAIWVESDSLAVVKVINKEWPCPPNAASCFNDISKLLKKFEKYQVSHSWREANRAADRLAKMNLNGSDVVLWPVNFPELLCNIIKEDAQGKKYPRV